MPTSSNDVAASLKFPAHEYPDFWSLGGTFVWCLRQSDIRIYRHDLAFDGECMTFETDHGRIRISMDAGGSPCRVLTIRASAELDGSREVARQICYQLSQRIMGRHDVNSILWKPTLQRFAPANFKWSGLRDMPLPVKQTVQRQAFFGQGSSLA